MKMLNEGIAVITNFLPLPLREEILHFEITAFPENKENYAVRSCPLPSPFMDQIRTILKERGITDSPKEAMLRVETSEGVQDYNSFAHIDPQHKTVVVVYLSNTLFKNPHQSGTTFWEHQSSKKRKMDLTNPRDVLLYNMILQKDGTDIARWKEWMSCPFEENSALIFDGLYFHSSPHHQYEKHAEGKRVTLSIFL